MKFIAVLSLFTFLICEIVFSVTVSSENLSLDFDNSGQITQIHSGTTALPLSSAYGGILLRDLTDADIPLGPEDYIEDFENPITNWIIYPGSEAIDFTISTNTAYTGNSSLLCVVTNEVGNQVARLVSPLIHISPGKKYRIQCVYKATRGYLSYENSNHAVRWLYNEYNHPAGNSIGYYLCKSNGTLKTGHLVVAPFVAQAQEWKAVGGVISAGANDEYLRLTISANLDSGYDKEGFYVDKVQVFELPVSTKNVVGKAWQNSNGITFTGSVDNFTVEAEWLSLSNFIEVGGTVQSTTRPESEAARGKNVDCPFDLIVSLPINAAGWNWLYDSEISSSITVAEIYSHSVSADYQSDLPVSLYPYGGISTGDMTVAVATPLTPPSLCELRYNGERGALEAVFHLGISERLNHSSANFKLEIMSLTNRAGFRGIIKWYKEDYAESEGWFETKFVSTNFLSWVKGDFSGANAEICAAYDTQQVMSVEYTIPDLVIQDAGTSNDIPPTLSGLLGIVETGKFTGNIEQQYYFTNVFPQIMRAPNGDPILKYLSVKSYSGGKIQGVFKINPSPIGVNEGYHSYVTNFVCGPAFRDTIAISSVLDAVQLDNFMSKISINSSSSQIAHSTFSLTYTPNDYSIGIMPASGLTEYLTWLRKWIDENTVPPYRAILINWWGLANPNACLPWIDICAGEVNDAISNGEYGGGHAGNFDPVILRYKRALAYHKPLGMAFEGNYITSNDVIDTLHNSLLYAMGGQFKSSAGLVNITYPECVLISREFTETASVLNEAGWRPLVMARCDDGKVFLERYGNKTNDEFFIVAQNSNSNFANGTIFLEPSLGINDEFEVFEYISKMPVAILKSGDEWSITFSNLLPRRVNVYRFTAPVPEPFNLSFIIYYLLIVNLWILLQNSNLQLLE